MNRRNLILGALFVAGVITLLIFLRGKPEDPVEQPTAVDPNVVELSPEAQQNVGLTVMNVGDQQINQVVKTTGVVSPDQARVAHILPLARGIVEKVYVQLGDRVRGNQPLILYDNIELGELIGEHLSLLGGLEKLKAKSNVARKFLDRAETLIEAEAIAQREYELRQAEYEQAVAGVESQRAELARVEEKLHRFGLSDQDIKTLGGSEHGIHRTASHNILRAPFGGVIVKYEVSQGELVDRGKELFTVVDTSLVWVLADLYEKDIGLVTTGGECQVTVSTYPNQVFRGSITYVSDFLDPASRTAKVRCVVPNTDRRLKLAMFATVEIPVSGGRTALAVPIAALQRMNGDTVVFIQSDQTHFEKRSVHIGVRGEEWAEVISGLQRGERAVTIGSFHLKSTLLRELIGGEE